MDIREERPEDHQSILDVNISAFGGTDEAVLIETLREDGDIRLAMVAVEYGEIVAHILFSDLKVTSNDQKTKISAVTLAPICVAPTHQRLGIGSELMRQAIEKCEEMDVEAIFVLGEDNYYTRFGFSAEKAECTKSSFSGPFFMVLDLKQGIFNDFQGSARYPDAFSAFEKI
ncbi:MAG: GNAT family N-acetyltransferase [Rhodospirillaceae bacterium]|nr:MAG: GNAT family N-acetyltransferase [Rhodospirillaceae bacterium]